MRVVHLDRCAIFDQLILEEALLRADRGNWCLFNTGSPPAVVLGISGKVDELVNRAHLERYPIPLIRRFSGGGTVVVGPHTLFATFIVNRPDMPTVACYPESILRWTETLYSPLLPEGVFQLNENDYGVGDRKFGGNAQYLCRDRWLHHSSLLWDFEDMAMEYLLQPKRQPQYRANRSHKDFLCRLRDYVPDKEQVFEGLERELRQQFRLEQFPITQALEFLTVPHRRTSALAFR